MTRDSSPLNVGKEVALIQRPPSSLIPSTSDDTKASIEWPSKICAAIKRRHLTQKEETIESARLIQQSYGSFIENEGDNNNMSVDIEKNLFELFIDDDYDGMLHLTTLRESTNDEIVGIVFWREVCRDEMKDWVNWDILSASICNMKVKLCDEKESIKNSNDIDFDRTNVESHKKYDNEKLRSSLVPVRQKSLRWLYQATTSTPRNIIKKINHRIIDEELKEELTHAWVKIELLAVRKPYWGHRYGSLLLAVALYQAWLKHNHRAILHVAGGYSNIPAVRLYKRFGFVPVKAGDDGLFHKPNRDLFVLGNIGNALQHLSWSDALALASLDKNKNDHALEAP